MKSLINFWEKKKKEEEESINMWKDYNLVMAVSTRSVVNPGCVPVNYSYNFSSLFASSNSFNFLQKGYFIK